MTQDQVAQQAAAALQRGITTARAGLVSAAASAFERAAELAPDSPEVWHWLAWTANSPDNAFRCLRRAIELNPDDPAAEAGLKWIARLTGQVVEPIPRMFSPAAVKSQPAELVRVANVASESLLETSVSVNVMEKPDRADVFQADALGWTSPVEAAASTVGSVPPVKLADPKVERAEAVPFDMVPFPAVVIPPPELESELPSNEAVKTLSSRIAEAVTTKVEHEVKPLVVPEPIKMAKTVIPAERPVPPPYTPPVRRREPTDPYADDDPRHFSELVRQASQLPLPNRALSAVPEAIVQSRFADVPTTSRPVETTRSVETSSSSGLWPALTIPADSMVPEDQADDEAVDLDALTRAFRPALFDSSDDGRPVVMVVDDSPTVRKLVALTLERRGFRVIAAADGVHAIRELGSCRPDLILLDITMPRLDGYRLCKLIKKHNVTQHIPVVMLSGKDGLFDKLRGRLVGCSDYITKPFEADSLTQKVTKYLATSATP